MLEEASLTWGVSVLVAVAVPFAAVLLLLACLQCFKKRTSGFSNFGNSSSPVNGSQVHDNTTFSLDLGDTNVDDARHSTAITIEPLPDIAPKPKLPPLRPRCGGADRTRLDASFSMIAMHQPFPRNQIVYLKELGTGWFGKAIESDAEKIVSGIPRSKVIVKMLKDDASKEEQMLFFEETAPYREIEHPNVVRLLGQCTEMHPMLMIMESAAFGNLKQYLRSHQHQLDSLIQKNRLIQFTIDAACGLACLHRHDLVHRDLSARNCLVMSDNSLKIGDYGIAEDLYKEDYMVCGSELLPIRWMAPESLKQENGAWSSHTFTKESDLWSLGVLLWETVMMGERPYDLLTDEAVLQGVVVDKDIKPPAPDISMASKDRLYEVMQFCWLEPSDRTKAEQVHGLLQQIAAKASGETAAPQGIAAFEQKWEHLMPNQRHQSLDSSDEHRGSMSSGGSDLLSEDLSRENSLEDLTAPSQADWMAPTPQAPPRTSKKKVSAPTISMEESQEGQAKTAPTPARPAPARPAPAPPAPRIKVSPAEEAAQQVQLEEKMEVEGKEIKSNGPESEFTEFTSHDDSDKVGEEAGSLFQAASESLASPDLSLLSSKPESTEQETSLQFGAGDTLSPVSTLHPPRDSSSLTTPEKSQAKPVKTSTPISGQDPSPSSSSHSAEDSSSGTFLSAQSTTSVLTEAYATASEKTLVGDTLSARLNDSSEFTPFTEASSTPPDSGSLSFEILDSTAIPTPDQSTNHQMQTPSEQGLAETPRNENPDSESTEDKRDSFGEFTNAEAESETQEKVSIGDNFGEFTNGEAEGESQEKVSIPADNLVTSTQPISTSSADDLFSFVEKPAPAVSHAPSSDDSSGVETSPSDSVPGADTGNEAFASFGTDLSSLSSLTAPPADAPSLEQQQPLSNFQSDLSSFGSLGMDTSTTPQAQSLNDPFGFFEKAEQPSSAPVADSLGSLGGDAFDMLASVPDVANHANPIESEEQKEGEAPVSLQTPDLFGDLQALAGGDSADASPDSGNQSGSATQQSLTDLFGFTDSGVTPEAAQGSSLDNSDINVNNSVTHPSAALVDFDLLSGFTAGDTPASQSHEEELPFGATSQSPGDQKEHQDPTGNGSDMIEK